MGECKCDMRTKLVGDGCKYCNPQYYIEILEHQTNDDYDTIDKMTADLILVTDSRDLANDKIEHLQAEVTRLEGFEAACWSIEVNSADARAIELCRQARIRTPDEQN